MNLRIAASAALVALPIVSIFVMAISWLTYGLDLPFLDDWRDYRTGNIARLDFEYLFLPANDTLYPVGRALDALAQRWIAGNSIAYQFISMFVTLVAISAFVWLLIRRCGESLPVSAVAFALLLFMFQPGSYWGEQNIAYHQAIPLVLFLGILCVATSTSSPAIKGFSALVMATFAGLAYTSGAFAGVALASSLVAFAVLGRPGLLPAGLGALAGSIGTSIAQAWVIIYHQNGQIHDPNTPWVTPIDADFWAYSLGKLGRSLMLHLLPGAYALPLAVMILAVVVIAVCAFILRAMKHRAIGNLPVVFVSLSAAVGVYLAMVASSRAGMAPEEFSFAQLFSYGFARFHFFWLGVLWPFTFVALMRVADSFIARKEARLAIGGIGLIAVALSISLGSMSHASHFRNLQNNRLQSEVACLRSELSAGLETGVQCPRVYPEDLSEAVRFSLATNASWVRHFDIGTSTTPVDLTNAKAANAQIISQSATAIEFDGGDDAQLWLHDVWPMDPSACRSVSINVVIRATNQDVAQIYFSALDGSLSEERSVVQPVSTGTNNLTFRIQSDDGFGSVLRLDPVASPQNVTVSQVAMGCNAQR